MPGQDLGARHRVAPGTARRASLSLLLGLAVALLLAAMLAPTLAVALDPGEVLKDPALEARARAISRRLRCVVCQNQSIDDSDAPLAKDLRRRVRERLLQGDTDAQVVAFVRARYGDFVLLRPPVQPSTWLLWFGPAVLLAIGLAVILVRARRRRPAPVATLSAIEEDRVARLIGDGGSGGYARGTAPNSDGDPEARS